MIFGVAHTAHHRSRLQLTNGFFPRIVFNFNVASWVCCVCVCELEAVYICICCVWHYQFVNTRMQNWRTTKRRRMWCHRFFSSFFNTAASRLGWLQQITTLNVECCWHFFVPFSCELHIHTPSVSRLDANNIFIDVRFIIVRRWRWRGHFVSILASMIYYLSRRSAGPFIKVRIPVKWLPTPIRWFFVAVLIHLTRNSELSAHKRGFSGGICPANDWHVGINIGRETRRHGLMPRRRNTYAVDSIHRISASVSAKMPFVYTK